MTYMSPPPTPPHTTTYDASSPAASTCASTSASTVASPSSASFRLPSTPTILLHSPSEDTVARLRQLAPYYWSHPQTTNCAIHFPIDPKQQARIQAYQAKQRAAAVAAAGSRSRQGSVTGGAPSPDGRRPSVTPPSTISRQSSAQRLRAVHSNSGLSARAAILGHGSSPEPELMGRRGSLTPGYDPFSKAGSSLVSTPPPSMRRESAPPVHLQQTLSPPPAGVVDRRGSAPVQGKKVTPMRTVRLHVEYLTAQSALIRQVLAESAGYKPPTSSNPTSSSSTLPTPPSSDPPTPASAASSSSSSQNPFPHSFFRFSPHRYPRVIHPKPTPSTASQPNPGPIIILPVPDPVSFPLLIHYMYHGKMDAIERTLREGQVSWEGLVRNVEYLGLREDVKRYLGKWWKNWRDSEARNAGKEVVDDDEDDEVAGGRSQAMYSGMKMDVDDAAGDSAGEWATSASASAVNGELVDEMAGLLGRF